MTEIPEHLLKRSQAAKSARTGGDSGTADSVEVSEAATPAAAAAAPAVPAADLPNLDPAPVAAKPEPVFVTAAKARRRIPAWALPVVVALPIWALSFAGTMQQPEVEDPLFVESTLLYGTAGCSGCHGASGAGGTGYALAAGSVLETFPSPIDQMVHVARGSAAIQDQQYGAPRADGVRIAGSRGQMPGQLDILTLNELELIVFHERATLSGEDTSTPGYEEWMQHVREGYEQGDATPIDLELLLACADPAITPGATGVGSTDEAKPCPGPNTSVEEAALG